MCLYTESQKSCINVSIGYSARQFMWFAIAVIQKKVDLNAPLGPIYTERKRKLKDQRTIRKDQSVRPWCFHNERDRYRHSKTKLNWVILNCMKVFTETLSVMPLATFSHFIGLTTKSFSVSLSVNILVLKKFWVTKIPFVGPLLLKSEHTIRVHLHLA